MNIEGTGLYVCYHLYTHRWRSNNSSIMVYQVYCVMIKFIYYQTFPHSDYTAEI